MLGDLAILTALNKGLSLGTQEIDDLVKSFGHKDLFNPQEPCGRHLSSQHDGDGDRLILVAHWPASLA